MQIEVTTTAEERVRVIVAPKDGSAQQRYICEPGETLSIECGRSVNLHITPIGSGG